ncbi:MAG: hypothetical protein V1745_02720 [Patescibacteria group bacterium]
MSHLVKSLFVCASLFVPSLVASCACDGDDSNPATSTTGHAGSGGGVGGTSVTAGNGGTVGTAGSGGSTPINPWGSGPGRPGAVTTLVRDIPLVQGISSQNRIMNRDSTDKCTGEGGSAGSPSGGAGGVGGSSANGGAASLPWCPTDYVPMTPTLDLSGIDKTSIQLALPSLPVFQPFNVNIGCPTAREVIDYGHLYLGDCTGVITDVPIFTPDDLTGFFGLDVINPLNSVIELNGSLVSVMTGLAVKSTICGTRAFLVSNGSTYVMSSSLDVDAGIEREEYPVDTRGLSGILCTPEDLVLFSSARSFTVDSWNECSGNPAELVVATPLRINTLEPNSGIIQTIAEVPGGSRIITQGWAWAEDENGGLFLPGTANVLTLATDGDILFGDHLSGTVWKISPDGQTLTELFTTERMFTGLVQAPNGVIYLALNARADLECALLSKVIIATYDEQTDSVVDWMTLDDPAYDALFPSLCHTGVIENAFSEGVRYLGGGNYNDLAVDLEGNLYVTETILNRTTAIHVVFDEPDAG